MNSAEWEEIVRALHDLDSVEEGRPVAVRAADRLHRSATPEDVPRLLRLLQDESFFVREAVAWPLSELAGATHLAELLQAYQRGFDEGHDNDGFAAALADMAEVGPAAVRQALQPLVCSSDESLRRNAIWLLQFCGERSG
jgi:HEAT repeat protein